MCMEGQQTCRRAASSHQPGCRCACRGGTEASVMTAGTWRGDNGYRYQRHVQRPRNDKEHVPLTEDVAASDSDRIPRTIVTFKADVAAGVGVEYEHDRRRTRPARARGAREESSGGGIIRWAGTDRLAHIACRLDHVQAGRNRHGRHPP